MIYFAILFVCFRDTLATHVMLTSNSLCNNNVEKVSFPQCVITGAESQVSDYQVGQWTDSSVDDCHDSLLVQGDSSHWRWHHSLNRMSWTIEERRQVGESEQAV